jgi:hypothetical protein
LGCTYEATEIFRQLVDAQPDVHLPYLAESLRQLARLAPDKAEGMCYAREAMQIYDHLIGITEQGAYVVDFFSSLFELQNHLSAHEAAIPLAEALACARQLVQTYASFDKVMPDELKQETEAAVDILKRLEQLKGE